LTASKTFAAHATLTQKITNFDIGRPITDALLIIDTRRLE